MQPERFALALAGGGAKGIYQIGAWEALRDLGVPLCAAVGASIGSLNAAFVAQGDYEAALGMWQAITVEQCLNLPDDTEFKKPDVLSPKNLDVMVDIVRKRGLDTSPFRATIERVLDEAAVMGSEIDYGLVLYSLTDLETVEVWRESIHPGLLVDYIMGSTRYPGLKSVGFGGRTYLDGGFGDNLPVAMLRRRGYRNIIAVDIRGGDKPVESDNIRLAHIRNRLDLGGAFDLTPSSLETNRRLGRLDTLVTFGRIDGDYYYFARDEYRAMKRFYTYDLLLGLQQAAQILGLPRDRMLTCDTFIAALETARRQLYLDYEKRRTAMNVDSLISLLLKGRFRTLSTALEADPRMKLGLLLELLDRDQVGWFNIPMKLFGSERAAAEAIHTMDGRQMWHKPLQ
ncbi:MAG: hypothetical protein GX153_10195 [Clostridiaceae bacterium]|nr:hypothetical protein [Clostridiaceae bacterium]